jgi:hypothetical protein
MASDEEIIDGMKKVPISVADRQRISKLVTTWADAIEHLPSEDATVRLVFFACLQLIITSGPAYCRIAIATLENELKKAQ